jgi:protein HIRA/HIR1
MNGGGPTAQIIERDGWKCDKDFVGHRKAITCVRFHNSILKRQAKDVKKPQQCCCLAIGSRDRTLSVWMTALQRPLLVIHDLFEDSILDLSWSNTSFNTTCLLACSGDGTLACLEFTAEQLGTPLSEDDKNSLYQRMYGKDANIDISVQAEKEMIIENADLLTVSKEKMKPPQLFSMNSQPSNDSTNKIVIAQPKPITGTPGPSVIVASPNKPILKQIETRTVDGKRRITPMFIPLSEEPSAIESQQLNSSSTSRNTSQIIIEKVVEPSSSSSTPSTSKVETPAIPKIDPARLDNRLLKGAQFAPMKASNIQQTEVSTSSPTRTISKALVPTIKMNAGKATVLTQAQSTKTVNEFRIQISNDTTSTSYGKISKVICYNLHLATDKKIWEIFIGSAVCNFAMCAKYAMFCSLDGTVRILDVKSGQNLFPVLNMTSPAVQSAFSNNCVLGGILTESGIMSVWDLKEEGIFIKTSCADVLSGSEYSILF